MPQLGPVLSWIEDRVAALTDVGLGYLSLDRATPSLSGGESQRVKLVRHLGSSLVDLTYVLDEPSAGLHPHDVVRIVALLRRLRDKGNTIVVVDHDPAVIAAADQVVDLGPGGGEHGGTLTYQGSVRGLRRSGTATGRALRHRPPVNAGPREPTGWVRVRDARHNNLVGLDVDVPLGVLVVLSGVAGSGKSTLATVVLPRLTPVTVVDQGAPRKSARSSVLTWLGLAQTLRSRYARLSGQPPGLFSRNGGGACSNCRGLGTVTTDLAYLEDVTATCETCEGTGYNDQALSVRVDGRTIADTRALTVSQASSTDAVPAQALRTLTDVGLSHVRLGQALSALSGGERQRLKLAATLQHPGSDLLILDEPTSGLHPDDVSGLLTVLQRAVDDGRSLLLVEHHPAVILAADWVIDLGPGAGSDGGRLLHTGPPAKLLEVEHSRTARHLQATR